MVQAPVFYAIVVLLVIVSVATITYLNLAMQASVLPSMRDTLEPLLHVLRSGRGTGADVAGVSPSPGADAMGKPSRWWPRPRRSMLSPSSERGAWRLYATLPMRPSVLQRAPAYASVLGM